MEATKESLQRQLGTPLLSQLSDEEKNMLDQLQVTCDAFISFTVEKRNAFTRYLFFIFV